jgi:predicted nucleotidyltransferase
MKSIQATDLRKNFFGVLEQLATSREPIEIVRFKEPIAVLMPSSGLPATKRKPVLDLNLIAKFCKDHQIKSFALFGSILRDDFNESSDVDVLIDLPGLNLDFHEECGLLDELEVIFGRKVDLIHSDILASPLMNKHRKAAILETAKEVYRAA